MCFWRITDLIGACLVPDGSAYANRFPGIVLRNSDGKAKYDPALVNVDRLVGKLEAAILSARIDDRRDPGSGSGDPH